MTKVSLVAADEFGRALDWYTGSWWQAAATAAAFATWGLLTLYRRTRR